jgi:pimeloyl-ACP methyl ester carboxylesterase
MLAALFARCAAQRSCHRAFPSPARDLKVTLARLDRQPLRIKGTTIGRDEFASAVQHLSRTPETAAQIPLFLRLAAKGDFAGAVALVQDELPTDDPRPQLMAWSIRCLEPWARRDEAETARLGTGSYLGPTMVRSARYASASCSVWPSFTDVPGADRRVPSSVPALVVVGGQDPQDPLANIAGITDVMPNAKIVVVRGGGHGAVNHGCTEGLADAFLIKGTAAGLDTSCTTKAPLTPFVLSLP